MKLRPIRVGAITSTVQRALQPGENLELLASGKLQGQGAGIIIVTSARLLFVQGGAVQLAVACGDVTRARSSSLSSTLRVQATDRTIRFDYVTRSNRARIARTLNTRPIQHLPDPTRTPGPAWDWEGS